MSKAQTHPRFFFAAEFFRILTEFLIPKSPADLNKIRVVPINPTAFVVSVGA